MTLKRLTRGPLLWIALAVLILTFGATSFMSPQVRTIDTSDGLALLKGGASSRPRWSTSSSGWT